MKSSMSNSIQNEGSFSGEIKITNDTDTSKSLNRQYRWFRYKKVTIEMTHYYYEYDENKSSNYIQSLYSAGIIPESGEHLLVIKGRCKSVDLYTPNLFEASQVLMNIDLWDDEKLKEFYREYGPLGIMPYLTSKGYSNFMDGVHRQVSVNCDSEQCRSEYWCDMFGVSDLYSFDLISIDECERFMQSFNSLENKSLYSVYQEPLWAVRYAILEFQSTCRLLCCDGNISNAEKVYNEFADILWGGHTKGEYYQMFKDFQEQIRNEVKIIPGFDIGKVRSFKLYALCNSLIHAIYLFTVLSIQHTRLEKCKADDCHKLFWKTNNRREYCSDTCKTRVGVTNYRHKIKKKTNGGEKNDR